jgi:coenzyme F420-0:L-glutamate ligase/coenzyme F420-1:gamma-L-glutamate ligase
MTVAVIPIPGLPMIQPGDDLSALIGDAIESSRVGLKAHDAVVVCQKVVSKAEGAVVRLDDVEPSAFARQLSSRTEAGKDPRAYEVVLREAARIVRMDRGHLITETRHGWVCANAGVDESNSGDPHLVILLPLDPDASAQRLVAAVRARTGRQVAVIVTDTFGRPWRQGLVDFALGVAGMPALLDLRGSTDLDGRVLKHTVQAQADALAAAAGLVMRKGDGLPVALVRGYAFDDAPGSGRELLRAREFDLFR